MLEKLASNFITPYLLNAVDINVRQSTSPGNAKVASVVPLEKDEPNKNDISNFWPVNILNTNK